MAKSKYTDEFKMKVAEAATEEGATLKSVGEKFGVNPTLVRNWRIQFASSSGSDGGCQEEVAFEFNETVSDNDEIMDTLEGFENKTLERGVLTDAVGTNSFDFSVHVCDVEEKHYLAIDIFSDTDGFSISSVNWRDIFVYVIAGLEDREIFGDVMEALDGQALDTEKVICLSEGNFIKFIDYV